MHVNLHVYITYVLHGAGINTSAAAERLSSNSPAAHPPQASAGVRLAFQLLWASALFHNKNLSDLHEKMSGKGASVLVRRTRWWGRPLPCAR